MKSSQRGFSLLEGLISLLLFLLIVLFSLDCFLSLKEHFTKLKDSESSSTAVYAAMDRMRRDLFDAGLGLADAMMLQIIEGISEEEGELVVLSKNEDLTLGGPLFSGQQRILTTDAKKIKKGQLISLINPDGGEVFSAISVDQNGVLIDSPITFDYSVDNTRFFSLRRISLYLDDAKDVIRRKVNASPAQPLLEDVASFAFEYTKDVNLVRLALVLIGNEEKRYETTVFPKNTAMASILQKE
jgi:hypothetical protein